MTGFVATASFFEDRVNKKRDEDQCVLLREVARFHRELAEIAPGFPPGYNGGQALRATDRWQARAGECRTVADCFHDPNCPSKCRLAETYDRLSVAAE